MALFFFNIHDGRNIRDTEGSELKSRNEVRTVALQTAGEIIRHGGSADLWSGDVWQMIVTDSVGFEVLALRFSAHEKPYPWAANTN